MQSAIKPMKPATDIMHRDTDVTDAAEPLTTPIYETSTFVFDSADEVRQYNEGKSQKFLYSRYANPTVMAVERKMALLEGAEAALVLSSGQAATTTAMLALVGAGDEIVCSAAIYGGSFHLLADLLPKFGVAARFVSLDELREPETVISENTKLVWFESPINPTLRCVDVAAVARACRARGVVSVIDNTFASPINQQPHRPRRRRRHAQRDEVSQWAQRRHRRRARRTCPPHRSDARRAEAARAPCSTPTPRTRWGGD